LTGRPTNYKLSTENPIIKKWGFIFLNHCKSFLESYGKGDDFSDTIEVDEI